MENDKDRKETQETEVLDASQNKVLWIIGAVILLVVGLFGLKMLLSPAQDYRVSLVDAPKDVTTTVPATFTWKVEGPPTTINKTEVYLGQESTPGELGKEVQPSDTKYTEILKDFSNGNYAVPLTFVGNVSLTQTGKYYYRVYAFIKDKHYWTDEYSLDVSVPGYKVSLVDSPKEVGVGSVVTFTWTVDGPPTTIPHTSVHFGTKSNPGVLGKNVKPDDTTYEDLVTEFSNGKYNIPLRFVGNTPKFTTAGTYYYRVHAIINGENYWGDEQTLEVK
ncbi:hypothetical protein HYW55_05515 [Candidatus Gottesmanbacteria bacterium]|nr:hypothetical protein [Candidatus Gottesmanbacteria bacterium]